MASFTARRRCAATRAPNTPAGRPEESGMESTLFTNVRILEGPVQSAPYVGSVLVEGKRIRRVSRSAASVSGGPATVIDAAGATLMPGMCEAHTHFSWNDAATLAEIQTLPLEEHVLWSAKVDR